MKHLPFVTYHARAAVPLTIDLAHPSIEQARQALNEAFARRRWPAEAFLPPAAHRTRRRFHQPHWSCELLAQNPHFKFYNNRRGYVRCTVTPSQLTSDFRTLPYVTKPGAPVSTRASFVIESGRPGAQLAGMGDPQ